MHQPEHTLGAVACLLTATRARDTRAQRTWYAVAAHAVSPHRHFHKCARAADPTWRPPRGSHRLGDSPPWCTAWRSRRWRCTGALPACCRPPCSSALVGQVHAACTQCGRMMAVCCTRYPHGSSAARQGGWQAGGAARGTCVGVCICCYCNKHLREFSFLPGGRPQTYVAQADRCVDAALGGVTAALAHLIRHLHCTLTGLGARPLVPSAGLDDGGGQVTAHRGHEACAQQECSDHPCHGSDVANEGGGLQWGGTFCGIRVSTNMGHPRGLPGGRVSLPKQNVSQVGQCEHKRCYIANEIGFGT